MDWFTLEHNIHMCRRRARKSVCAFINTDFCLFSVLSTHICLKRCLFFDIDIQLVQSLNLTYSIFKIKSPDFANMTRPIFALEVLSLNIVDLKGRIHCHDGLRDFLFFFSK